MKVTSILSIAGLAAGSMNMAVDSQVTSIAASDTGGPYTAHAHAGQGLHTEPWSAQGSGNGVAEVEFIKHESSMPATKTLQTAVEIKKAQCARMCSVNDDCAAFMWQKMTVDVGNCYFSDSTALISGAAAAGFKTFVKATPAVLAANPGSSTQSAASLNALTTPLFDPPVRPSNVCAYTKCAYSHVNHVIEIDHHHLEHNGNAFHNCRYDHITQICGCTCQAGADATHMNVAMEYDHTTQTNLVVPGGNPPTQAPE